MFDLTSWIEVFEPLEKANAAASVLAVFEDFEAGEWRAKEDEIVRDGGIGIHAEESEPQFLLKRLSGRKAVARERLFDFKVR